MATTLSHTWYMTQRQLRNLSRQPFYIAFTLVQPVIYLIFCGSLFQRVTQLPGFDSSSYISFLTPGIVMMSALFGGGWSGMGLIRDLDAGVLDRFLVSPASRFALIAGRIIHISVVTVIQTLMIVVLGVIWGARFPGGLVGVAALVGCAVLLAIPFSALACGLALVARKEESVIAVSNFLLLPLTFVSSVFMAQNLMPDWSFVFVRAAWLLVFGVVGVWLATLAFRAYQRSI